jgi:hypothetical protein
MPCKSGYMKRDQSVSHDWEEETPEAKTRWFRSLSMADRMQMLCDQTDLALSVNPYLPEKNRAKPTLGRILILSSPEFKLDRRIVGGPY